MKTIMFNVAPLLAAGALVLTSSISRGQTAPQPVQALPPPPQPLTAEEVKAQIDARRRAIQPQAPGYPNPVATGQATEQKRFDLDFGGGQPEQLVQAIEKSTGEPLNAIVRDEDKDVRLPPLKVRDVTVDDLFLALEQASRQRMMQVTGSYFSDFGGRGARSQYSMVDSSFGFKKQGNLWVFRHEKPVPVPDSVNSRTRFYNLEPYLENHNVEDITTAVRTAWEMMNEPRSTSDLKFHKETKLLIAVGDEMKVQVIDDVLKALRPDLGSAQVKQPEPQRKTNAPATNQFERN